MPRSKDPAVLFYTSDFLAGTMLMTNEQKGKYITLLCLQHLNGHLTKEDMLAVCGKQDKKIFSKFSVDEDGNYYNERMDEEKNRRQTFIEKQSERGSKGGRPPKATENPRVSKTETQTKANATGNGNGNINDNGNLSINNISIPFPTTTTTIDDNALPREESDGKKPVMVTNEGGELVPLTDDMLAEIRAQNALEKRIRDYFEDNEYISSAELFIQYNNGRGWLAHGDVDIRKGDKWMLYADEWERKERLRQGIT